MASSYIAWYLFLAGAGSGAFVLGGLVDILLRFGDNRVLTRMSALTDAGLVAGPALVALGSVFLIFDLGAPERAFQIFLSPAKNVLGFGAWSILLFCVCAVGALAIGALVDSRKGMIVEAVFHSAAVVMAICVMVYAGVFLSMWPSVPFLHSPLVPVLFIVSALTSGAGVLIIIGFCRQSCEGVEEGLRSFVVSDILLIVTEIIILAVFVGSSAFSSQEAGLSVQVLLVGEYAALFWLGVVGLGLLAPLAVNLLSCFMASPLLLVVGSCCTLVGGVCLRFALLLAAIRFNLAGMIPLEFWI